MNDLNEIEKRIISTIKAIPPNFKTKVSNTEWTNAVKTAMGDLGTTLQYDVYTGGLDKKYEAEWLYDLVWCKHSHDFLEDVVLVLESEWSNSYKAILYDFEKLLLSKSYFKVMIFEVWNENQEKVFNNLESAIKAFKTLIENERYLLFGYNNNDDRFHVKAI